MVNGLFFEISLLDEHFSRCIQHSLGRIKSDGLDGIDDPLVNLVRELIQIDILIGFALIDHTEHVDGILCKHRSELDVHTSAADSEAHLLGLQVDFCLAVLLIEHDARDLGRAQCALDVELHVRRVVDDIDILIAELAHDTMHAATLHTYAGAHGIDALIVALHSHLCTLAWHTGNLLDGDQAVVDFGHLGLKEALKEHG